jgi:Ala-tRNA(Pro) deacylase
MNSIELLKERLATLGVSVDYYEHKPIFTFEEGIKYTAHIPGIAAKNLFLRDKKNQLWLVVMPYYFKLNIRKLATLIETSELQFAKPEQLLEFLDITPGSVTPLALINDKSNEVKVILDKTLMAAELIQIHPLRNDMTVTVKPQDLMKFIESCRNQYRVINLEEMQK